MKPSNSNKKNSKPRLHLVGDETSKDTPVEKTDINDRIIRIGQMIERIEEDYWFIADELVDLRRITLERDGKKISYVKIAEIAMCRWKTHARYQQVAKVAELFPVGVRNEDVPFSVYENGEKAGKRLGRTLSKDQIACFIAEAIDDGNEDIRSISEAVREKADQIDRDELSSLAELKKGKSEIINSACNASWESLIPKIEDGSIDAVWADPPFMGSRGNARPYEGQGSVLPSNIANGSPDEAKATTYAMFDLLPSKMAAGAPLYIHQHGGLTDDPELIIYARERGWRFECPVDWIHGDPETGTLEQPVPTDAPCTATNQRILVAVHGDAEMKRVGKSAGSNVFVYPSSSKKMAREVGNGRANKFKCHAFMHPHQLAAAVIERTVLTGSGGLVFEPFGCTGPGSVAALRKGWSFIYAELDKENFRIGANLILDEQEKFQTESA